jgi:replicative DNA helicase
LVEDDFYRYEHRLIFSAIASFINASKPADVITVFERLKSEGKADEVGGLVYLDSLAQYVPSAANIRRYAEIVRDHAMRRKMIGLADEISASSFSPAGKSAADLVDEAQAKIFALGEMHADREMVHDIDSLVVEMIETVEARSKNENSVYGLRTGFYDLDRLTCGLQPGDLIVLAARPAMGKTSLALNIAENVSLNEGLPVAVFSMEMGAGQLTLRIVSSISRVNQTRLRSGKLTGDEWPRFVEGIERMRGMKTSIDETPAITAARLRTSARKIARRHGGKLGLIVVDYIQLMSTTSKDDNRSNALGEISRGLKQLAKEMNCPIIALSQLNRGVEQRADKRPMMSDLRESGNLEQDADIVAFIYRDDYYNKDSKEPGIAEVIIAKHRNGPTATIRLAWLKELTKFESLAHG